MRMETSADLNTAAPRRPGRFSTSPDARYADTLKTRNKALECAIGREIRTYRRKFGITVATLSAVCHLSIGMLSKIENGEISPSLSTLQALSRALGVPLTSFFQRYEEERTARHVKAETSFPIEHASSGAGRRHILLGQLGTKDGGVILESSIICFGEDAERFPAIRHSGSVFLYMLEGEIVYCHGGQRFQMAVGDSLSLVSTMQHGPEEIRKRPVRYLSVISHPVQPCPSKDA